MAIGLTFIVALLAIGLLLAVLTWRKPLLGALLLLPLALAIMGAFVMLRTMRAPTLIHPAGAVVHTGPDGVNVIVGPAAPVRPDPDGLRIAERAAPAPTTPPAPLECSEEEAITGGTLASDNTSFRVVQMISRGWDGDELVLRLHLPLEAGRRLSELEYLHAVQADGADSLGDYLDTLASATLTEDSCDIERVARKLSRQARYLVAREMFTEAWAYRQITAKADADDKDEGDSTNFHDITVAIGQKQLLKALRDARVSVHRNRPPTAGLSAVGALALVIAAYLVLKISTRRRRVGEGTCHPAGRNRSRNT